MMNKIVLPVLSVSVFMTFWLACSSDMPKKYSRSDCIVEVELEWQDRGREKLKALNLLADKLSEISYQSDNTHLAGYMFQNDEGELYLQFDTECGSKLTQAETLLSAVTRTELKNHFSYQINSKIVEPGRDTIMLEGSAWTD